MRTSLQNALFIGIDLGTSGCRGYVIDANNTIITTAKSPLPPSIIKQGHVVQNPLDWWLACQQVLHQLLSVVNPKAVEAICVDGTSGTVLLCEKDSADNVSDAEKAKNAKNAKNATKGKKSINGKPVSDGFMYNDTACVSQAKQIKNIAPNESGAHGASSGLAKCLYLSEQFEPISENKICLNQADWIAGKLLNRFDTSDENNALKMGYDPIKQAWPQWLKKLNCHDLLPQHILQPGDISGIICADIAEEFHLRTDTKIIAGTTDSIAAFIATGCENIGEAVTSLGSTLAIKLISHTPVFSPKYGVYSHRLGNKWLVGGASNSGGAVIKANFTNEEIQQFSQTFNYSKPTGLNYYPLLSNGERFPISEANKTPVLTPRPKDDMVFFQGILEGIATIEKMAFDKLTELGAPYPTRIITMGGGSQNEGWRIIREKKCKIPILNAKISEAAYGSALLAKQHTHKK